MKLAKKIGWEAFREVGSTCKGPVMGRKDGNIRKWCHKGWGLVILGEPESGKAGPRPQRPVDYGNISGFQPKSYEKPLKGSPRGVTISCAFSNHFSLWVGEETAGRLWRERYVFVVVLS